MSERHRDEEADVWSDTLRLHWGWLGTSAVLWVLIGAIVFALIKGWP